MLFESDVKIRLKPYMRNYSEDFNGITSQVDELETLTQSAVYNGWYFDIGTKEPNRALTFDTFTIYLAADASFDLFVFDASTGEQLFKETYSGTEGLNTYRILKS